MGYEAAGVTHPTGVVMEVTSTSARFGTTTLPTQGVHQGLSRLCFQCVIWTPRTLFFDTQKFISEFAGDDFS